VIDERVTIDCPKCATPVTLLSRPIVDEAVQPQRFAKFMNDELNPKTCGACGLAIGADTPCVVLREHWIGIVLANPQPIAIDLACKIVFTFLSETPGLGQTIDRPVLVTANAGQLRRMIQSEAGSRFCSIRFDDLAQRNWSQEIVALNVIADAYMEHDLPEQAYWVFESALATFPDLYFNRRFFDAFELSALAAGDRIAKNIREPRTAPDDFEQKRAVLEPQRPEFPDWMSQSYLCFYEDDREFSKFGPLLWNVRVELQQIDEHGQVPFESGELHFAAVPVQAVQPQEPSLLERGVLRILIMLHVPAARQMLPEAPTDFAWVEGLTGAFMQLDWDRMSWADKQQLHAIYAQFNDGRDLVQDFELP